MSFHSGTSDIADIILIFIGCAVTTVTVGGWGVRIERGVW
jgi:hypothetical protein